MIHAYNQCYLDDARENLGEAIDWAVRGYGLSLQEFSRLWAESSVAREFGNANPKYLVGMSGWELCQSVLERAGRAMRPTNAEPLYGGSPEHWCGWSLAFCQWWTGNSFANILKDMPLTEFLQMYPTMHEASDERFLEAVEHRLAHKALPTHLHLLRVERGLTQAMLCRISGTNLRTLQQYESRAKDINKASAQTLLALSRALYCRMEDLMEYVPAGNFSENAHRRGRPPKAETPEIFQGTDRL